MCGDTGDSKLTKITLVKTTTKTMIGTIIIVSGNFSVRKGLEHSDQPSLVFARQ